MPKVTCPGCGNDYQRISFHWNSNPSHRMDIDSETMDILKGVLIGDGYVKHTQTTQNPMMVINMTNKKYLEWLDERLGWLSNGIYNEENSYRLSTMCHPDLDVLYDWYSTGKKRIPEDLKLNKRIVRHWYCCDGGLRWAKSHTSVVITSTVYDDNVLNNLFINAGFDPSISSKKIRFSKYETERFLDIHGPPPPGFEYKWEYENYDEYQRLKEEKR